MEIRKLNTLRAIAVLIVMVSHYSNETRLLGGILGKGAGQLGVMLFFLLSGFLMSYLYMGKEFNRIEVCKYAISRAARVGPLFLIVVLCSYLFCKSGFPGIMYKIPNKESLISHIALLSGTSVLWTIPPEIQFYLVFIFLWWFWRKRRDQLYLLISLLIGAIAWLGFPVMEGNINGIDYKIVLIRSLPYFLMGLIFGQLYNRWNPPLKLQNNLFIFSLFLIPLFYPKVYHLLTGNYHRMWEDLLILFFLSLVFFIITFLVPDNCALISNCIGDFIGKISYSLYLLHLPLLLQIKFLAIKSPELFLPIFLLLAVLISYISYSLIENPARASIRAIATQRVAGTDP